MIDRQPKQRKVIDDSDIYELRLSQERYESAINSIVANNDTCIFTSNEEKIYCYNLQHDDMDFIRDDDYMQSGIADLTACFNE